MLQNLFSQELREKGSFLVEQKKVQEIVFSKGAYQISVIDDQETFWPFLQLSDAGEVKDHFCTCKSAEKENYCVHQAAAWIKIFNGHREPLHRRFELSFWNHLCQMGGERHGYSPNILKKDPKRGFEIISSTGKHLFSLKPKTEAGRKKIKEIIQERKPETEETSLKFFALPLQELNLWKQGCPSRQLQYELSFWSDLAKWWMLSQETGVPYSVSFKAKEQLPNQVVVELPDCRFAFYVPEVHFEALIPSIATIESPLKVFDTHGVEIQKILYDPLKKALLIDVPANRKQSPEKSGFEIGSWLFVPEEGFYPSKNDALLKETVIRSEKIGLFLDQHRTLVQQYLVGTKISLEPVSCRYHLEFDKDENLLLSCYLFEKEDFQKLGAALFGRWAFFPGKGFFLLEGLIFEGPHKKILKDDVSEFINLHRHWLHDHEGFETHITSIESKLSYHLSPEQTLYLDSKLDVSEEGEGVIDFGEWVYLKGRGFYAKTSRKPGHTLKPGLKIPKEEIASFIRSNREELETVSGFFTTQTPLQKTGLHLDLNDANQIVVRPEYTPMPLYEGRPILIFENYTYVEREGFCEIPFTLRLPSPYFKETLIDKAAEPYFVSYEIDTLSFISVNPRLKKPRHLRLQIEHIDFKEGHWIVDLHYTSEVGSIDAFSIWEGLNSNRRYLFSPAGLLLLRQPRFNWLKSLTKKKWYSKGRQLRLTTLEWIRLFVFDEIEEPQEEKSLSLLKSFQNQETLSPLDTSGLKSQLRNYQETGLQWLWFLYNYGLSGLLCDEMGLGKTHQAMALLAAAANQNPDGYYLVVCPTSVIFHWEALLKNFLPDMRPLVFYGTQRKLGGFGGKYNLLLTSYGTLRSEKSPLSDISFDIAIFDELQIAKNAHSQTHKALKSIDAKMRVGLTGTPIENRLLDLKALFDVVLPSYMPTETVFKEFFVHPIEKQNDSEKKQLLSRFIKPFLLRRKKSDVLLELPEKTEVISYVPLSKEQKKLYRDTYLSTRPLLLSQMEDPSQPIPYTHIFSLLTKLKQICDHPAIVLEKKERYKEYPCGKWDLFVELLKEARESEQKIVVFSQYLDMLDIIESYLTEEKISFAAIRGSTKKRKEEVHRFQNDPACTVFVGSLQAAGVGIDLIAASIVVHYDRWWNPAKENQATDRVHRMGQSRGVQVFKLVTKGTIEEHIHQLIEKKIGLAENTLGFDDHDQIKKLSKKELVELIHLMEESINPTCPPPLP